MYSVRVDGPRPDFRVFIDLLFGPSSIVDTDGDCVHVYSRDWEYLVIENRADEEQRVCIEKAEESKDIYNIESQVSELALLTAVYLYVYCGTEILENGLTIDSESICGMQKIHRNALSCAHASIWHNSSALNPYPNSA